MNIKYSFLFLFLLFLGGCAALKKRENAPTASQDVNLNASYDQAVSSDDFTVGKWPIWNWWIEFGDDQLTSFINHALAGNPDLKAAVSRVRSSQEEAKKVRSSLFPKVDTSFSHNYEHLSKDSLDRIPPSTIPAVVNQTLLRLNFDYEIDLFGKNRETYLAAVGEARSRKAEMSQAYLMITASLTKAYFDYQAFLLRIEVQEEIVSSEKILFELTEKRALNSLDNQITLEAQRVSFLEAVESLVDLKKDLDLTKSEIKILMGLSPDDEVIFELPQAEFDRPFPIPEELPMNLIARRPDLMMQIWKVEAAAHLIGAARAAFFPNINLGAFVGLETITWSKLFSLDSFAAALAPAINLPLFTGWRLTAGLNQSFADYDSAVFDYNALVLKSAKDVSDGLKILEATNQQQRLQKQVVESFTKASDLTDSRFQNGVSDYLESLRMKVELLREVEREVDIQNDRHQAVLNLIRALGGGYYHEKVEVKG